MTFSIDKGSEESSDDKGAGDGYGKPDFEAELKDLVDRPEQEIDQMIEEMCDKYEGLVHRPAAAILVGRQLDVEVVDKSKPELKIANLVPDMHDVEIKATVNWVGEVTDFGDGRVRGVEVGDDTAATKFTFWDEDVELLDELSKGDTVLLKAGYTKREVSDWQQDNYDGIPAVHYDDDSTLEVRKGEDSWHVVRSVSDELDEEKDELNV